MISANKFAEVQKIVDDDPSARWTGWKNIALNLWDAYQELDQEADYLARSLAEGDDLKRSADYWRVRAERVMEHD